jgi:hypothetical protein
MNYAKLINNTITIAPNPILHGGSYIGNPPGAVYVAEGYKVVQYTEQPEAPSWYYYAETWTETDDAIVQGWELVEAPITEDEALVRYANELTGANDETLPEAAENLIKIIKENN